MGSTHKLPVHVIQYFNVPPETIFDAWLKPDIVRQWLFASSSNQILHADIDPRPGGSFSILERNGNDYIDHFGKYQEISRPSRLVFSLEVPKHFPGVTQVIVQIEQATGGSLLTFTQTGVKRETTESNWREMLQQLNRVLNN